MGKASKKSNKKRSSTSQSKHGEPKRASAPGQRSSKGKIISKPPNLPLVLFRSTDRILLVGEGDFSFSKCLLESYHCTSLLATSYDSRSVAIEKYPQALYNIDTLNAEHENVLFEVDATKIGTGRIGSGGKRIKKGGFDRIVFNFPHVGGKTKDLARQVRYNQELLLGFFKAAVPLLAPMGLVIVTVFEGAPYDTWDLKGLAKDAGLKSQRSLNFESGNYPGYKHARTLGNIEGGGGWKGEDRPARTYLLELVVSSTKENSERGANTGATGSNMQPINNQRDPLTGKRKRKRAETESDSD